MDLRRCPACGNMVARGDLPDLWLVVWGRGRATRRARTLLVALLALLAWRLLWSGSGSSDADGPRVSQPATHSR